MLISEFQRAMEETYGQRDRDRGVPASVAWLTEEVGELAQSLRKGSAAQQEHEFADVLAWTFPLANQPGLHLEQPVDRYAHGCPKCGSIPCHCE